MNEDAYKCKLYSDTHGHFIDCIKLKDNIVPHIFGKYLFVVIGSLLFCHDQHHWHGKIVGL
jgi:uncharacterized cysteine cluster protein YcgN (CxxCxxCC family)